MMQILPSALTGNSAAATSPSFASSSIGSPSNGSGTSQNTQRPPTAVGPTSQLGILGKRLFQAIIANSIAQANQVYFPKAPFLKLKAVPDPSAYYTLDLFDGFHLDLTAYHHLLLQGGTPHFLGARALSNGANWIAPGTCGNRIGYWHLQGLRLVYSHGATIDSVAVLSIISWQGHWYVVHLGAFTHPYGVGVVTDPEAGPGLLWAPGGC